jgi:hypothetical protein
METTTAKRGRGRPALGDKAKVEQVMIRMTTEERRTLEAMAGDQPMSAWLHDVIFAYVELVKA